MIVILYLIALFVLLSGALKLLYHNEKILNPNKRGQPLASVAAPHIYGEISAMVVLVHYIF